MDTGGANPDAKSDEILSLNGTSENGGLIRDLDIANTMLARLELCLAMFSEKVRNMRICMMHLETMESEFEALDLVKDRRELHFDEKVMEFDLFSGVLDSEVRELDQFLTILLSEIADAEERVLYFRNLEEIFLDMQESLLNYKQYFKQAEEQFSEIKMLSANFQRALSSFKTGTSWNGDDGGATVRDGDQCLSVNVDIKLQTTEQQRNVLRMLEKSLAREMDLEKNYIDSRKIEEELKLKVFSLEQELVHMEEEVTDVWAKWFEADNASEVLMGISRDLLGKLQISPFNLNTLSFRESEVREKLETCLGNSKTSPCTLDKINKNDVKANLIADDKLTLVNSEASSLREKVSSLEKQLNESKFQIDNAKASANVYQRRYSSLGAEVRDMENLTVELKENISKSEFRTNSAEAKCLRLTETNTELNVELALLKDGSGSSESVDLLKKQLKESDVQLQHAISSAVASQENQNLLCSTIRDMENVIEDLKSKIFKAESRANDAEENCIILSESNAELNQELSFLRNRLACLEETLHRVEEEKAATANQIGMQTKAFKILVAQLVVERERISKKISSLAIENKILVVKLKQTYEEPSLGINGFNKDSGLSGGETNKEVSETSATGHDEVESTQNDLSSNNNEAKLADTMSDFEPLRRIDAGVLDFRHLFIAVLVLLISAGLYLLQQHKF